MRLAVILVLVPFLLLHHEISGQDIAQYEGRYKSAVNDYKQGKYAAAMEKLSPLTSASLKTPFAPYAHYYYGLSAYQLKRYRESRQMLNQLQSRYPGWNRINDVYYLLGAVGLESGQYKEGLEALARIKDSGFAKDVQGLKQHHFASVRDLATLIHLQREYPTDRDLALVVIQHIENTPNASQVDRQFAGQLQRQFKFTNKEKAVAEDAPKRSVPRQEGQWSKGYYDVSVLLPFRLDDFSTAKRRSNQFAYDYYLGLSMAKEQLMTEGIQVNLWAYDVSNDAGPMESIAVNKNFQQSDLVIGPLYPNTFDIAAEYAIGAGTYVLNPLSTDLSLLKNAPNIYLGRPSINYQTQRAAQYMKSQAPGLSVAIYFGNTSKDSSMASLYAEEWKKKGGKVSAMTRIQADREWLESHIPSFAAGRPGHFALFSSDGTSGPNLIEALNTRKLTTTPIVATSTSFNPQQSRLSRYGTRLTLIDPDYVDREKENIRLFQRNYWNKTNTFPSVYSYLGYDQLMFFAKMLDKHKGKLSDGIRNRRFPEEDFLLAGFDYTDSNENQITPVLRYNGLKWVPVER